MRIKHFVITRFNMPIFPNRSNGDKVKNNDIDFLNKGLIFSGEILYTIVDKLN